MIALQATEHHRWQGILDDDGTHIGFVVSESLGADGRGQWSVRDLNGARVSGGDRGAMHEAGRGLCELRRRFVAALPVTRWWE